MHTAFRGQIRRRRRRQHRTRSSRRRRPAHRRPVRSGADHLDPL